MKSIISVTDASALMEIFEDTLKTVRFTSSRKLVYPGLKALETLYFLFVDISTNDYFSYNKAIRLLTSF